MMSKTWLIAAAWLLTSVAASAQEPEAWRPKYVNLSFVSQKLDFGEDEKLKSRFGAAFTTGRSYYLHKKPVAGMIRFGIDATWIDLSYANYSREETYDDGYGTEIEKLTAHQAEIGMQVGPSVTVRPLRKLQAHLCAFFRRTLRRRRFPGQLRLLFRNGAERLLRRDRSGHREALGQVPLQGVRRRRGRVRRLRVCRGALRYA